MILTYTPKELDYFELSPKNNVTDYIDPLEYIAVVKASVDAGKLNEYSLLELQKVEKQLSQACTSLSNEKIGEYESTVHQMFADIINLQNAKEDQEKRSIEEAVSFLNEVVDTYDADAPDNRARKYIGNVRKNLAVGKFDNYDLAQLQEVEQKIQEAYSSLSFEEQETVRDAWYEIYDQITDLQMEKGEIAVDKLIREYHNETDKDPQSRTGFKPGMYKKPEVVEIMLEDHETNVHGEFDIFGFGSVELLLANFPVALQDEVRPGKNYPLRARNFQSAGNKSYRAGCVTSLSAKSAAKYSEEDKVLINQVSLPRKAVNDNSGKPEEVPASLETIIAVVPKPRNKIMGTLAKTAFVAAAGIASLVVGYNYLAPSLQKTADTSLQHYHGSPSVEATATVTKVKHAEKYSRLPSEEKSVETGSKSVEQPAVAHQVMPRAPKKVEKYPPVWEPYDENLHTVEKGETLAGLYEDYAAQGGTLSRADYIKTVLHANPHLENANTIYVGQKVVLPN